jgi:hypothetical protein
MIKHTASSPKTKIMKKLILPLGILLFTAACHKQELPAPVAKNTGASAPMSRARVSGDTLAKIVLLPEEKGPVTNQKGPTLKK